MEETNGSQKQIPLANVRDKNRSQPSEEGKYSGVDHAINSKSPPYTQSNSEMSTKVKHTHD